jgi:hypothetical protein
MTNERTKQCGVYEISKKQISFDLGYSIDRVSKMLKFFISKNKIRYNESTNEIGIGNWLKYNFSTSPKVQSCINKEFALVKDTLLIEYVKSMDTQSQDKNKFKDYFPEWNKTKLAYYYDSALSYSAEGNKYANWGSAIRNWAKRDELQGKLKFDNQASELQIGEVFQPKINFY